MLAWIPVSWQTSLWSCTSQEHFNKLRLHLTCTICYVPSRNNSLYLRVLTPSVWLTFCTWCFPGCACSIELAAEPLSLVDSTGNTTPARRRRRVWMTGRAFIVFEFQSKGVWLICCTSAISCNELSTELFTACKTTHSLMLMELNSSEAKLTRSHKCKHAVPCGLQLQFVVMLEPCYILAWVPISWQTSLWSCTNQDWFN